MKKLMILCATFLCAMTAMAQTPLATQTESVDCKGSVQITATPADGYHFIKWVDAASTEYTDATMTVATIQEAKTYTAFFALDETVVDESIDPQVPLPQPHGTVLQIIPKTDDDCLEFDHWSDLSETDAGYNVTPRDFEYNGIAPTFKAIFKTKTYNIEVKTEKGTTTEGSVSVTVL